MNKGNKKERKFSEETILLITGGVLLVILVAIIVYSFLFLVNNVLPAINSRDGEGIGNGIHFDLGRFDELGL